MKSKFSKRIVLSTRNAYKQQHCSLFTALCSLLTALCSLAKVNNNLVEVAKIN